MEAPEAVTVTVYLMGWIVYAETGGKCEQQQRKMARTWMAALLIVGTMLITALAAIPQTEDDVTRGAGRLVLWGIVAALIWALWSEPRRAAWQIHRRTMVEAMACMGGLLEGASREKIISRLEAIARDGATVGAACKALAIGMGVTAGGSIGIELVNARRGAVTSIGAIVVGVGFAFFIVTLWKGGPPRVSKEKGTRANGASSGPRVSARRST